MKIACANKPTPSKSCIRKGQITKNAHTSRERIPQSLRKGGMSRSPSENVFCHFGLVWNCPDSGWK